MRKVHYLQSYIILKNNSMKECILKTVHVNSGRCGRLFLIKLCLVVLVSGKFALREWFGCTVLGMDRNVPILSIPSTIQPS